jgi:alkanesulfonate monooxygenase SsuD/methylene tetrahydromethanopterin reductase-like flavin-dependent oxidoreductase (luciferase family)
MIKMQLAFQLSAMGSPTLNFYNDAYARAGFQDACTEVRNLWLEKKRDAAIQAVPDEMVQKTAILGDEAHVRTRIRKYHDVGITDLMVHPIGGTPSEQLDTLGRTVEIIKEVGG